MNVSRQDVLKFGLGLLVSGCAGEMGRGEPEAEIYLLAGQSNMQGLGRLAELQAEDRSPPAGVFFWNGQAFEPFVPGRSRSSNRPGEFGPELGLAQFLAKRQPARQVYLIKYSRSGQPLHPGWDGNCWAGGEAPGRTNFYPGLRPDDPARGRLYQELLGTASAALAALRQQKSRAKLKGLVWMQGEQDSKNELSARDYPFMLKLLKKRLGDDLGQAALPLVYGQVLPYQPPLAKFTHRERIRQAMADADSRSGKPEAIPGAFMVSTEGMSIGPDHVHYDAAGQLALGRAFGEALLRQQQQ
ncbi:MAG: hypothetical protein RL095_1484 [Verrucomicrobiota bacterium]|jgi:hypothetical protein